MVHVSNQEMPIGSMIFLVSPQMAYLNRCKIALVALVWFFSTMSFDMFPQTVCPGRYKIALIAFVIFLAGVSFQMPFKIMSVQ